MKTWKLLALVLRARANGLLRLRPVHGALRLDCLQDECGRCCKYLAVTHMDPKDNTALPILMDNREDSEAAKIGCHSRHGGCVFFEGGCQVYQQRPNACREYPWYSVRGRLYYDAGCPGIRSDGADHPDPSALTAVEKYFPVPNPMRAILLWLVTRW